MPAEERAPIALPAPGAPPPPPPLTPGLVPAQKSSPCTPSTQNQHHQQLHSHNSNCNSNNHNPTTAAAGRVEINGEAVPRALVSAFADPHSTKKPFSYFTGGLAPAELDSDATPSSIRRTQSPSLVKPLTPRVLPIVSDDELELEDFRKSLHKSPLAFDSSPHPAISSPLHQQNSTVNSKLFTNALKVDSPLSNSILSSNTPPPHSFLSGFKPVKLDQLSPSYRPISTNFTNSQQELSENKIFSGQTRTLSPLSIQTPLSPYNNSSQQPQSYQTAPLIPLLNPTNHNSSTLKSSQPVSSSNMAATGGYVHTQFNDPINLYSKSSLNEAFNMATGGGSGQGGREFDPKRSHVLAYLQEDQHAPPPRHSARIDEPAARKTPTGEVEYPHYRGFVDPNLQSPSFHRIEWATGGPGQRHSESASQQHQHSSSEVHSATHHSGSAGAAIPAPAPAPASVSPGIPTQALYEEPEDTNRPLDPQFAAKIAEAERPKVPAQRQPSWTARAESKHERWQSTTGAAPDPRYQKYFEAEQADWSNKASNKQSQWAATDVTNVDQQYKKEFGLETPFWANKAEKKQEKWRSVDTQNVDQHYQKSFGTEVPSWAHKAEQKHQKWERHAGGNPIEQNRQFTADTPSWAAKSLGSQDKWEQHYSNYHLTEGKSGTDRPRASSEGPQWRNYKIAPVSVEHTAYRTDEWMKPYIAPPLRGGTHGSHTIQTSHSSSHLSRNTAAGGDSNMQQRGGGQRGYGRTLSSSATRGHHDTSWITSSSSSREQQTRSSGTDQQQIAAPVPRPVPIQHNIGGTGSYSQTVSKTSSSNWQHGSDRLGSADAERQKRIMEEELRQRQSQQSSYQQSSSNRTTKEVTGYNSQTGGQGGTWHVETTPHGSGHGTTTKTMMVHRGEAGAPAMPQWGSAEGATTKATTSGEYDDPEGHKVHYTKEVYTSSDPGKEFSMLTEEEKKVMEQPLQPGVISRHITTKYYKKSTYTSSTTTGTTGSGPVSSSTRLTYNQPLAIDTKPAHLSPGVTQF